MPIYEYQCNQCHHTFDLIQKVNDEPVKMCPECAENTVVRLVSAAGFQLKGTGWYETDFKNKGKPPVAAPDSSKTVGEKKETTSAPKGASE